MSEFTIGYLSWKKHNIIKKTLDSHQENGLFNIILPKNRIIYFQEISEEDRTIANEYELNYMGNSQNIGILNAFIKLVENCKTPYFIFCENDFILMDNNFDINKTLEDVSCILKNDLYAQVKLSNSKNPGFLYISGGDEWLQQDQSNFRYKVESLSWIPNPKEFYHNINSITHNYEWLVFKSDDQNWSNHIHVCNTKYLKEVILPLLRYNRDYNKNLDVKYQGLEDTLIFPDKIPNPNEYIKNLIKLHSKRKIYSGGGNFYHNK